SAAAADGGGEFAEGILDVRGAEKQESVGHGGRRGAAEEDGCFHGERVPAFLLSQDAESGERVAEDSDATRRSAATGREGRGVQRAGFERGEDVQLDGRAERGRAAVGARGFEKKSGGRDSRERCRIHRKTSSGLSQDA